MATQKPQTMKDIDKLIQEYNQKWKDIYYNTKKYLGRNWLVNLQQKGYLKVPKYNLEIKAERGDSGIKYYVKSPQIKNWQEVKKSGGQWTMLNNIVKKAFAMPKFTGFVNTAEEQRKQAAETYGVPYVSKIEQEGETKTLYDKQGKKVFVSSKSDLYNKYLQQGYSETKPLQIITEDKTITAPPKIQQEVKTTNQLWKNPKTGQIIDPTKYTNLRGQELENWARSQGYEPISQQLIQKKDVSDKIPLSLLTEKPKITDLLTLSQEREDLKNRVLNTYHERPDAIANEAFVQAVAKAALGRPATSDELKHVSQGGAVGASLRDVLNRFGLIEKTKDFGVIIPEKPFVLTEPIKQTTIEQPTTTETKITTKTTQKSASDQIIDLWKGLGEKIKTAKEEAMTKYGIPEKQQALTEQEKIVADLETQLANQGILDMKEIKKTSDYIKGQPIPMSIISRQLRKKMDEMTFDQKINAMLLQNEYKNALLKYNIMKGDLKAAENLVKETAEDTYKNAMYQLEALKELGRIENETADKIARDLEFEKEMALKGYIHITDPKDLEGLTEQDIVRMPDGKIYLRPREATKRDTQIITAGGRRLLIDKQTGEIIRDLGNAYKPTKQKISQTQYISDMAEKLSSQTGSDGYVSPDTYKYWKRAWVMEGLNGNDFDKTFRIFANPEHLWDYGLE